MPLELHSRPVFVHSWVGSSSSRFFSEEAASSSTLLKRFSSKQHPMCAFSLTLVAGKSFWRFGKAKVCYSSWVLQKIVLSVKTEVMK